MTKLPSLLALALCAATTAASAQTIWRCGPDGRSYSDAPCPDGRAVAWADTARPAADVQAAQARAERDAALAESLRRERLQREAQAARHAGGAAGIGPTAAELRQQELLAARWTARHPPKTTWKKAPRHRSEPDIWRATAPASRQTRG